MQRTKLITTNDNNGQITSEFLEIYLKLENLL